MRFDFQSLKDRLATPQKIFTGIPTPPTGEEKSKASSVVLPIYEKENSTQGLILQKRNSNLKAHPGQISFPGGAYSKADKNLLDTALREWEEEMGESSSVLEVLGEYDGLFTHTGFHISPFIARYNGSFLFNTNPEEVERSILLDLNRLETAPFYSIRIRRSSAKEIEIYYFDLEEELLWGITGKIIVNFLRDYANFKREPILAEPNLSVPPFFDPARKFSQKN
ncbi:CoA pyrophosphatase [Leptospira santarosai]|uniref:NUDIX domain protein n=2 Tax=Leptospira santarosai TaxID=28183 RepID=M6UHN8_9LEPT|nr:CoA pyrophosphatase [Leptospira santarosai]ASV13053.1 coenzyme A pyrophosphatase [Leptospira santarosai]AVV77908.1 NUDIX domain protein [Leptospira santarosai]EKO34504.1 NUDIX domain protein [Leptospira santarosai str. MOR084]EKS09935.1 NUDIX domain protein [Leptospira santarosai str. JET]EMJ47171.1 NUDIX domain protein [Leptospira santarosai str. HAI1349]